MIMSGLPPTATLFPYTTLFRSDHEHEKVAEPAGVDVQRILAGFDAAVGERVGDLQALNRPEGERRLQHENPGEECRAADRKSTRLNSSHLVISYAVFCLKKKKQ